VIVALYLQFQYLQVVYINRSVTAQTSNMKQDAAIFWSNGPNYST